MPKIFYISGSINFGAPGRILEQMGLLAQKHGYEVMVAHSTRNENPSQLPHFAMTTKCQEVIHAIGAKFLDLHGLLSTKQTKALVERIKEYQPDIIHLHNIHGYFCNFKVLFEYLDIIDTPIVWTMHDCWPFTGRCFHFVGANCYKWKTGCYDCQSEAGYTVSKYVDRSKSFYELKKRLFSSVKNMTMVPVSNWQATFLKDSFLKNCNVHTIHNGVDLKKFLPVDGVRLREKHQLEGKFVLLGVASPWNMRKGLGDFCKLRLMLSFDFAIILVGLKPEQMEKLPEGIIGISRTESQRELAEYYSMADVFVNLTYLDTFPTVNLEALACGTPVLTYKTGGSPEAVDEQTGVVVEQRDLKEVVRVLCSMKRDKFSSSACRKRAEELFDKDKCFESYIELYDSLIHI
ncbi:glycosyltransferase [Bacteroides xylanisolvens]|uniref:glycosyltransferase n=1 Tax=Bacteroides xylanisolvens TaxID=371601 RepID=UPI001CDCD765|nr:glycosyltransferase [Bacteroides xylanisolvens]MCA4563338.1 glycosyltransferase [Bacteroides xylanisolvens]